MIPFPLRFDDGRVATGVRLGDATHVREALDALGLTGSRPVLVLIGGAGGLGAEDVGQVTAVIRSVVTPTLQHLRGAAVDGGTHAGVMRLLGEARSAATATFPLLGVAAEGTVRLPGDGKVGDGAVLDPGHTHVLLVPGAEWGAESPWLAGVADELAGTAPSVTVLVNGGEIAYSDVEHSVDAGRPVLVLAGSGRTADDLARALRGEPSDERASGLVASGLVRAVPVTDRRAVARQIAAGLSS